MKNEASRNLKFICSWDGKDFAGYQIQPHANTIEATLTKAWKTLTGENIKIIGCSRLDAGVHAESYIFNIHTNTLHSTERIIKSLNGILHQNQSTDICIYRCEEVDEIFHSRFSAIGKHYRYFIWHGFSEHQSFRHCAWHIKTKNSLDNLENILKVFEGTHNYNSFCASDCSAKNTIKTIHKIAVKKHKKFPELYMVDIFGDGFLKNMIRNIIGAAILVMDKKKDLKSLQERLSTGHKAYNLCAPPWGLTLMEVFYSAKTFSQFKTELSKYFE